MRTFEEITAEYVSAYKEQENRRKAIKEQAYKAKAAAMRYYRIAARKMGDCEKLNSKANKCYVSWVSELVVPLVEEVNRRTGLDFDCSDLRTYGLRCECPVFAKGENGKTLTYLCFTPGDIDKGQVFIDSGEKSYNNCSPNSLGALNGYDNIREEVTSIEVIIDNIKRNNKDLGL